MATVSVQHLAACLDLAESEDALGKRVKEALDVVYDVLETYGCVCCVTHECILQRLTIRFAFLLNF